MIIKELPRNFVIEITDAERIELMSVLLQHKKDIPFVNKFHTMLEGMNIL